MLQNLRIIAVAALAYAVSGAPSAMAQSIEVFKSESCACCELWVKHLQSNGFAAKGKNVSLGELARLRARAGLRPELQSCHTGRVAGYLIEGHVPASDVKRLLAEKLDAIGLSVPGMPLGSPGMEAGDQREPYEVLLVKRDGTTEVFARH
jgi:hypothetical protein